MDLYPPFVRNCRKPLGHRPHTQSHVCSCSNCNAQLGSEFLVTSCMKVFSLGCFSSKFFAKRILNSLHEFVVILLIIKDIFCSSMYFLSCLFVASTYANNNSEITPLPDSNSLSTDLFTLLSVEDAESSLSVGCHYPRIFWSLSHH